MNINEHGVDMDYFWEKVMRWAADEKIWSGREVPFREIIRRYRDYTQP